ncbi:hypothetical protein HI914_00361 [Erysiphe necator]|uniref:Putative f-box domain-containing protein n=1 Tax=Uncinula necator TaxID=52586 RepID=A0A0B1PGK2_UNCNE|nr:hypothetical protein HI914_00361 [Erysiphe necator]KHJ35991.1 putative f-box domain-containing protein [Erysiphe necator]
MDSLPPELILYLVEYLDPIDIAILQHVSRRLYTLTRDNVFWRLQCFTHSNFMSSIRRREGRLKSLKNAILTSSAENLLEEQKSPENSHLLSKKIKLKHSTEYFRILANWDPSYPSEKVDWYHEFIARNAPISLNWLEQPMSMISNQKKYLEVKGMGIISENDEDKESNCTRGWVVSSVEDGSVCLWDIRDLSSERRETRGTIAARSREYLLSSNLSCSKKQFKTMATECVSVDSRTKKAYFAAENCLIEIDLETLSEVRREIFPFPISALSEARYPVPLTVGTTQSLHLFDTRAKFKTSIRESSSEHTDCYNYNVDHRDSKSMLSINPKDLLRLRDWPGCAHLQGPGPLSILHMPNSGTIDSDIYLAGRFPSILVYDRRKFPEIGWTIHSGARLSSIDWLPLTIASEERDLARYGELSIHQVEKTKTQTGRTLIACGEYNSKGSLEMYGLSSTINSSKDLKYPGYCLNYSRKNRQTSSNSKLLAVANHGTRIVVSDGGGNLRWFERDGFTQSRCWNIAKNPDELSRGVFGTQQALGTDTGTDDIIIKILGTASCGNQVKNSSYGDLIVWTGEKIGLVNFSNRSKRVMPEMEESAEKIEAMYVERMRSALVANADEVRWMRDLGVGAPSL